MRRMYAADVLESDAPKVLVRGWVHNINRVGKIAFVQLRDRTGIIQVVADDDMVGDLRLEMSIEAVGDRVVNDKAPSGVEIHACTVRILGTVYYEMLPFEINKRSIKASLETQLDHRTVSLRPVKNRAIFKVQQEIEEAFRNYLKENGFTQVHTPKIISSATEGGSEMFTVDFFGKRAFLAQSPQFYKQMMVGAGFERVFEVGHAYRAELHNTWRHLGEYVSMDVEMGFIESMKTLWLWKRAISYLFRHLRSACAAELEMFGVSLPVSVEIPGSRWRKPNASCSRNMANGRPSAAWMRKARSCFEHMQNEYGTDFVFLTKYPTSKRPIHDARS